ncbi:MAG: hypothetical protein WDW38_009079 [Sanguina aurantia]
MSCTAISRRFSSLSSLRLTAGRTALTPLQAGKASRYTVPLSTLTFPHLRTLTLPNFSSPQLILAAAQYPKLQSLCVEQSDDSTHPMDVQLQLPSLLSLSISGIVTNCSSMAASICAPRCPLLQSVQLERVSFQPPGIGATKGLTYMVGSKRFDILHHPPWELDMPACTSLRLRRIHMPSIQLQAPRLCELNLSTCHASNQAFFTLLPDIPCRACSSTSACSDHSLTGATADTATAGAASHQAGWVAHEPAAAAAAAAAAEAAEAAAGLFRGLSTACQCGQTMPGELKRLKIVHNSMVAWIRTASFQALCEDPRVRSVQDLTERNYIRYVDDPLVDE